jgi:hypothetical protein
MDKIAFINYTVNAITAMDSETRIAIAHRLLAKLEEKKDVTRWQFWDRYSVKEHGEEMAERTLSDDEVNAIMDGISQEWSSLSVSLQQTDNFLDAVKNHIKS